MLAIDQALQTTLETSFTSLPEDAPSSDIPSSSPNLILRPHTPAACQDRSWIDLPRNYAPRPLFVRIAAGDKRHASHSRQLRARTTRRNALSIAFGILGAVIGSAILILCGRSVRDYYRRPQRNLVTEHIDRFNLERELAEIEEAHLLRSNASASTRTLLLSALPTYQETPRYEGTKDAPPLLPR